LVAVDDRGGKEYNSNNNGWCALRRRERVGLFAVAGMVLMAVQNFGRLVLLRLMLLHGATQRKPEAS
jgi:hypothetical protein